MTTRAALVSEMSTLRAAVAAHAALIAEARWQRTLAMEAAAVPTKWGGSCYDLDAKDEWRYPSVAEASRQVAALEEADGYYWACSRLRDLEGLLGASLNPQLPLATPDLFVPLYGGHVPPVHDSVSLFVRRAA